MLSNMDHLAGPSNAEATVFAITASARDPSYYSNLEPDFKWVRSGVKYLIFLISVHFDEFYDKTLKKKVLWKKIAEEMRAAGFKCTSDDCDKKYRNIKKSYVGVLAKQVQGDFSSKFPYFDQMHAFLGKEIDPLGMREQGLNKAIQEKAVPDPVEFPRIPFYEVTEDDNFVWTESAVHLLLDLILEHREIFKIKSDIDSVWESITEKMCSEGYNIFPEQSQRKWVNLSAGFRHYQAEAEVSGINPKWSYFSRVRHVINTLNVPVTVVKSDESNLPTMKGSLSTPIIVRQGLRRRKRRRIEIPVNSSKPRKKYYSGDEDGEDYEDCDDDDLSSSDFDSVLRRLQRSLKAEDRLSHLEARIESAQKAKAAARHSNNMLGLILGELKRINKAFEVRKEQLQRQDEEEERLKEGLLLNHVNEGTPIVDEAACRQAILDMQNITNFQFVKAPKVELVDGSENDGIIIVEGL